MRKFVCLIVVVFTLAAALAACSESDFNTKTYKSLKSAEIAYDTGMKVAADAHKNGVINDEQKAKVIEAANKFHASFMVASATLELAVETKDTSDTAKKRISNVMTEMWLNYDEYKALIESLIKTFNMPEVTK